MRHPIRTSVVVKPPTECSNVLSRTPVGIGALRGISPQGQNRESKLRTPALVKATFVIALGEVGFLGQSSEDITTVSATAKITRRRQQNDLHFPI